MPVKAVDLYTDGACRGNPGPGGWGVLLRYQGIEKSLSGVEPDTTNNRMELRAAVEGLRALRQPCLVNVYTDSEYLQKGITVWLSQWKKGGWRTTAKKPVKNQDLWQQLEEAMRSHRVQWHWVRGHSGHLENERVDALAKEAVDRYLEGKR